jgi:hypothetical protein
MVTGTREPYYSDEYQLRHTLPLMAAKTRKPYYFSDDYLLRHTLPLEGQGREALLMLPRRLTAEDAERLVRVVQSLAMGGDD